MYPIEILHKFKVVEDAGEHIQKIDRHGNLAVAVPRTFVQSKRFNQGDQVFCFNSPDNIYDYALKFLMRKDFPLAEKLNEFIKDTSEYGIITKWLNEYRYKTGKQTKLEYQTFNEQHISVAWTLFLSLQIFAFCILLVEILVHKKVQQLSVPFWRVLEMIIDPHRHFLNSDLSY